MNTHGGPRITTKSAGAMRDIAEVSRVLNSLQFARGDWAEPLNAVRLALGIQRADEIRMAKLVESVNSPPFVIESGDDCEGDNV